MRERKTEREEKKRNRVDCMRIVECKSGERVYLLHIHTSHASAHERAYNISTNKKNNSPCDGFNRSQNSFEES